MSLSVTCPSCGSTLRVKDELRGRNIRCAKCSTVIKVEDKPPGREERIAPQPSRPSATPRRRDEQPPVTLPARKSNLPLIIGLVVGLGALLGLCCCGGGVAVYFIARPETNPRLTSENVSKVKLGMTLTEVEAIVDKGKVATLDDVRETFNRDASGRHAASRSAHEAGVANGLVYRWKDGSDASMVILFNSPPSAGGKARNILFTQKKGNASSSIGASSSN
jgi:predicted Zn finger-like uncharacterized protein